MSPSPDTASHIARLTAIDKATLPPDGGEQFNRLIFARSPYLLQHAENPVEWYEWGSAAFDRARAESLPILLSIGYATCHWCHVMAHESFEDSEVAALLNRHFVCIKVDREERPDIDDFYMAVSQTLTGSGGWPLNIFMTPDKLPFMAITYLPKRGRDGMSGLLELLANLATLWRQRPDMIERNCHGIMTALQDARQTDRSVPELAAVTGKALRILQRIYDHEHGGFGSAPKFPMPIYLSWLIGLEQDQTPANSDEPLEMALHTLRKIRSGGIWDHLGGGLHRYSVDTFWLAPHFEKMLYDQAMLAQVAIEAYKRTGERFYRTVTEEILDFTRRELMSANGAFCSALDADSEGVEGKFYVWDKSDIDACLGPDSELFCRFHAVTAEGNFEGATILTAPTALEDFCRANRLNQNETAETLEHCRRKLLKKRETRIRPLRDDKIITAWNGLMISALASARSTFGRQDYLTDATGCATFILASLRRSDGRLLRSYLNGASDVPAFLEDYAFLAGGLLDLYDATLDRSWLSAARNLADDILRLFRNPDSGDFTLTGHDAEQMPTRVAADHDGVTPSALARTAQVLYRLAWIDDRPELLDSARAALSGVMAGLQQNPQGHLGALQVLKLLATEPAIATFTGDVTTATAFILNTVLHNNACINPVIRCETGPGPVSLSLCMSSACYPPVHSAEALKAFLNTAVLHCHRS